MTKTVREFSREEKRAYATRHRKLLRSKGKASNYRCVDCDEIAVDWSQIHETSGQSDEDYEPRCRSCHRNYDMTDQCRERTSLARMRIVDICVWGHDLSNQKNVMLSGRCAECNRSLKRAKRKGMTLAEAMEKEGRTRNV